MAGHQLVIMRKLKTIVPLSVKKQIMTFLRPGTLIHEFWQDSVRYRKHSAPVSKIDARNATAKGLETQMTVDYHRVEKGLALATPKRPFGAEVKARLIQNLEISQEIGADTGAYVQYAEDALQALNAWNSDGTRETIATVNVDQLPSFTISKSDLTSYFNSRRSVRHFDKERSVERDLLEQAVALAGNSPSVCNRQAWHVYFFQGDDVETLLAHQNGNAGFRDNVPCLAIFTADTRLFRGPEERNQAWIDGSLFSMSMAWALHGLGLASWMVNWSKGNKATSRLREVTGIPDHDVVIMMMAIGHPGEGHRVARSSRRTLEEIATFN